MRQRAIHRSRPWRIEPLEPRLVLSAAMPYPLVGDAQFVFYDADVYGTTEPVFERDASAYDPTGVLRDAGERRFADPVSYAPPIEWTGTGVVPSVARTVRVLAAGWDHDGVTPMAVARVAGERLDIYRGAELTLVGSLSFDALSQAAGPGRELLPEAVVIFNGLVVIANQRLEDVGSGFEQVGVTFLTTQDYGETLQPVAQVGGGTDVPPIADGVATGNPRLRSWSFLNAFPVGDINEPNAAWFPWADYLGKLGGDPAGGQIGLFKATRPAAGEPWTVEPNRLVYERWEADDTSGGGLHAHTAAITSAGLVSHWGDTSYRNEVRLHEFDLEAYETAPVTTTSVYGGYDADQVIGRAAPQPVAAAPGATPGEHLASGDLRREMVLRFGDLDDADDYFEVDGVLDAPLTQSAGANYVGAIILHLHWVQGVGWVSSNGIPEGVGHFSTDGEDWVAFNHAAGAQGRAHLYGDRLLGVAAGNELHLAPLPEAERVRPLALAPGSTNLIAPSLENQLAPEEGLSMRQVEYADGLWRYTDTGAPLDAQPEAPPFPPTTPIYEAVSTSSSATSFGTWWLQPPGETADVGARYLLETWVANIGDQSVQWQTLLSTPRIGGANSSLQGHEVATNQRWVAMDYNGRIPRSGDERLAAQFNLTFPSPGARFLVAWPSFSASDTVPYPIAPGDAGPDESEVLPPFTPTERWSVGVVAAWPESATLSGSTPRTLLTLDAVGDRRVEVNFTYDRNSRSLDRLDVAVFDGETVVARNNHEVRFLRDETFELVISGDGSSLTSIARSGSMPITERVSTYGTDLQVTGFRWGSSDGPTPAMEPILVTVDPLTAASTEGQRDWLHGSLQEKALAFARNAVGDYNGDGLVNAADYTVWRDSRSAGGIGGSADGDRDGEITAADYGVWAGEYGTVVPPNAPGDYNGDGLVNAADYTVWRDGRSAGGIGASADGDRDREITAADYGAWAGAYGTVVPTLAEVLATPLGASSPSTAASVEQPVSQPQVADALTLSSEPVDAVAMAALPLVHAADVAPTRATSVDRGRPPAADSTRSAELLIGSTPARSLSDATDAALAELGGSPARSEDDNPNTGVDESTELTGVRRGPSRAFESGLGRRSPGRPAN